ncbi:MAG: LysR family transcriptional regulator [Flavobacteriaceae bacterium]
MQHRDSTPVVAPVQTVENDPRISWDDIRIFIEVAELGSLRAAAQATGISLNTIRKKIEQLENRLGYNLLARTNSGVRVTREGKEIAEIAQSMREGFSGVLRLARQGQRGLKGRVKVAVTEGLGTFWLIPRLVDFQRQNPGVHLDLQCDMRVPDMSGLEADIAIQLSRPTDPELVAVKIGVLHLMLFASEQYLREHGAPASVKDIVHYHFVEQISEQVPHGMLQQFVPNPDDIPFISVSANTSTAHAYAITRGAGIGLLPTYARAISRRLRPVLDEFRLSREIWLSYHPDSKKMTRNRAAIEWLRQSFDPVAYPWFRQEFIHPNDMSERFGTGNVVFLFDGFVERE